jgi:hypothetical protein
MAFKVGDIVEFGADEEGFPLWDVDWRRDADFECVNTGRVVAADAREFVIAFQTEGVDQRWVIYQARPPTADEHWFRLAGTRPTLTRGEPVWTEIVKVRRRSDLPEPVRERMLDAGERGVRRTLRSWPADSRLVHEESRIPGDIEDRVEVKWYWETI